MLLIKRKNKNAKVNSKQILNLEGFAVPIHIHVEQRNGSRISLLKKKINIRLPSHFNQHERQREVKKLLAWATKRLAEKNIYSATILTRNYWEAQKIIIYNKTWAIVFIENATAKNYKATLSEHLSQVEIYGRFDGLGSNEINEVAKKLLIKIFTDFYRYDIANLVSEINDKALNAKYGKVSLKYINSRWGSCSMKGNISISLRLLFAPKEVLEYVILHELCHLEEMNHSLRFWLLVAKHMPDYKIHERWLKENGHLCDF